MKKIIYSLIAVVILIAVILFFTNYFLKTKDDLKILTNSGEMEVKNFYSLPSSKILSKNNDTTLADNAYYNIYYNPQGSYFIILLYDKNLKTSREKAEADLLKLLNIKKEDACKLNLRVGVPFSVNKNYAGINLGLSFCDGSIEL